MLVTFGFVIVMLIVVAGGLIARFVERENAEKRRKLREAMQHRDEE